MKGKTKITFFSLFTALALIIIFKASPASAASLFLSPKTAELKAGQNFDLWVRVDSEGQGFNAAQAAINFPADILEVKSLDFSPSVSAFNFWLDEPKFSNTAGSISFIGGTTNGVVGNSIQILKISFQAKGSGDAAITISDAAITASDGSGTNILSTIETAKFRVTPGITEPSWPAAATSTFAIATSSVLQSGQPAAAIIEIPAPIVRKPTSATKLPEKPNVAVPIYSDQEKWYNLSTNFIAHWDLPSDISAISTALNKNSGFIPAARPDPDGLFDAKIFPALEDGIWYLHIRFKNNIGWGPAAHYKLTVDTAPPLPFLIDSATGAASDNPAPTLLFKTSDGLSGLDHYLIRVGNGDMITTKNETYILPLQEPGRQAVTIWAADKAGNEREATIDLEILPIASPSIAFIDKEVFAGEGDIMITGSAIAGEHVLLALSDEKGTIIKDATASVDQNGNWNAKLAGPFKKGQYSVKAIAQDDRGAKSLPVDSGLLRIREKPLLTIGSLAITQFWFFVMLLALIAASFFTGWMSYRLWRRQLTRKTVIAQRDVANSFASAKANINKVLKNCRNGRPDDNKIEEMKFLLKRTRDELEKKQKYIIENIDEIIK